MTKTRNKSVYNHGRKVHIDYLHGVTLCYAGDAANLLI